METVAVLIVDDHTVAREGLRAMLETDDQVQVVGEAADGQETLEKVAVLQPQVVLMDVRMPRLDGLEATRQIKESYPTTAVIMMTSYGEEALMIRAVQAGASGYLLKDASRELLSNTIRAVVNGGTLISSDLLRRALCRVTETTKPELAPAIPDYGRMQELTDREWQVLELLAEGKTNKGIAGVLSLAEITVKKHVQSLIVKLHASNRTHAAITAIRLGLIK